MSLMKTVRCICCLIKCSKYLYFAKKILCAACLCLLGVAVIGALKENKCLMKKLRGL